MITRAFRKAMGALHRRGRTPNLDPGVLSDPDVRSLIDAHTSVLDSAIQKAPMSEAMRRALGDSNFIFSGIKVFHELNEAFPSLVDSNGDLKPFEQFLNDVQKIDQTYNRNYLRAEYNFAVAAAQGAGHWEQIEADGDRYDLQYRATIDERTREAHLALNGVTLPPSHPFWQEFYPPNGWNCRCRAVQVRKGKYPNTDPDVAVERGNKALARDKKGIFRFNPGQQHKTFPDYNPYTIRRCRDCDIASGKATLARTAPPDNELCQACKLIREYTKSRGDNFDPEFGERLAISKTADKTELTENIRAAKTLLTCFPDMKIRIREHIISHGVKNPEYEINGLIADRKGIESEDGVTNAFVKAKRQGCNIVVLDLDMKMRQKHIKLKKLATKIRYRELDFSSGAIKECYIIHQDRCVVISIKQTNFESILEALKTLGSQPKSQP